MSSSATSASGPSGPPKYRTVRELGSRSPRSYAAIREPNELVVMHRYARAADARSTGSSASYVGGDGAVALGSEAMGFLLRDAKCLEQHWHPNIARVRHVDLGADDLVVATELVDGASLADLLAIAAETRRHGGTASSETAPLLPLPVVVRILVDVLAGLHGLHGLRDATRTPLGVIHGALCPSNIVVGKDGVARLVNALRPRPVKVSAASEGVGYAAPEALDVGGTSDLRSDLHSVGVILWEAVTGRRLYEETDPVRVLARQREEEIDPLRFPPSSPFAPLADVVMCALAFDPALRFKTSAEMGAALRNIAGSRIASGSVVAAQVSDLAGDRIRARRVELDPSSSGTRRRASHSTMQAAQTAGRAFAPQPLPAKAPPHEETPSPPSRRETVPPTSLLDTLQEEASPTSDREELSIREMISSAPPVHESAMVATSVAPKPPRPPPPVSRKPPRPTPSMTTPAHVSPLSPSLDLAPPLDLAPALAPALSPSLAPAPAPAPALSPSLAPERTSTPHKTFAPVVDSIAASDSAPSPFSDAPPPPPVRKASPAVLVAAAVLALLGAGLALRAIFSDHPSASPPTAATPARASTDLPSTALTAPTTTPTTTTAPEAIEAPASPPSIEPPTPDTTATPRAVAPSAPISPPAAQPRFAPAPARPAPPARPKKPYEPSAI